MVFSTPLRPPVPVKGPVWAINFPLTKLLIPFVLPGSSAPSLKDERAKRVVGFSVVAVVRVEFPLSKVMQALVSSMSFS